MVSTESSAAHGALHGIVVVDLSRVLAGPLCTQILSDHGATVIKVEPPAGDETRTLGPPFTPDGEAAYFSALNRGKRAISLNLADPRGREVLERLLRNADVLVENFLPGTMEKWGLGYESVLAERFPRLIHASVTGFGADGPLGGLPGYDAVLQAMCGLMSVNGDPQAGTTRVGVPVVDHLTGYAALVGILLALHARERSGRGQRVEATLFDTALSLLLPHAANWLYSGQAPGLLGSAHPNIAPYDKFKVSDGEIFIGLLNDGQFARFCRHIGKPGMAADPRFATNPQRLAHREALKTEIETALRKAKAKDLCEALMKAGVPAGAVNTVPDAFEQPHAKHRGMLIERDGYRGVRSPSRLYGTPAVSACNPPAFAQDADALLAELGYSQDEIAALRECGAAPSHRKA